MAQEALQKRVLVGDRSDGGIGAALINIIPAQVGLLQPNHILEQALDLVRRVLVVVRAHLLLGQVEHLLVLQVGVLRVVPLPYQNHRLKSLVVQSRLDVRETQFGGRFIGILYR